MELKRIKRSPDGANSEADLQHAVVSKIEARYEAERRQQRRRERIRQMKNLLSLLFFLVILAGLAYFVWCRWFNGSGLDPVSNLIGEVTGGATDEQSDMKSTGAAKVTPVPSSESTHAVENFSTYMEIEKSFTGLTLDYWKNALAEDRPNAVKIPLTFTCLVMAEGVRKEYYELTTAPRRPMSVRRLLPSAGWKDYPLAEFKKAMANNFLFMKRGGRVYLCSPTKKTRKPMLLVPKGGETFECGKSDFGELYEIAVSEKFATPRFAYEVSFRPRATKTVIKVGTFPLGKKLRREDFVQAAAREKLPDIVVDGAEVISDVKQRK